MVLGVLGPAGRQGDRFERNLGRPVGEQKSVGLLVSVGELRIAEAREGGKRTHHAKQIEITVSEVFRVLGARVTPGPDRVPRNAMPPNSVSMIGWSAGCSPRASSRPPGRSRLKSCGTSSLP